MSLLCVRLQVDIYTYHLEDRGSTLIWTVQQLPALVELHIEYDDTAKQHRPASAAIGSRLTRCKEVSELHSRSLTRLRLSMVGGSDEANTLRLVGLPNLRCCELIEQSELPLKTMVDAASFGGVQQLQLLHLEDFNELQLQLQSFEQLTGLTSLTLALMNCGLWSVPADVALLSATLCNLDLSFNGRMQVAAAAVATITQCSRLTTLGIYKPGIVDWESKLADDRGTCERVEHHMELEGYTPAQSSAESLSHMMQLPSAFHKLHGKDLLVCVTQQEYTKYISSLMQ